jgi:apolipoprotein D and lipocalin family protein
MKHVFLAALILLCPSRSPANGEQDPKVVDSVDVQRYLGKWLEIGHYPTPFQTDCVRSSAEYGLLENGRISVLNTCFRDNREPRSVSGSAFAPDAAVPAKLKVDFGFGPPGDYWIIELDTDYQWVIVSGPAKQSLFILAREAPMAPKLLSSLLEKLEARGFDTKKIIYDQY